MRTSPVSIVLSVLAVLMIGLGVFGLAGVAEANGAPQRVILTYLPNVSNWGPTGATGIAEFVQVEGQVRFTALGLPKPDGVYALWLTSGNGKQSIELGEPTIDDQGVTRLDRTLPEAIPDQRWETMVLTVEKPGAQRTGPSDKRSIAGYVGEPGAQGVQQLPRTGDGPETPSGRSSELPIVPMVASALGGGAVVALSLGLVRLRRGR